MEKQALIDALSDLNFICLDDDPIDREIFSKYHEADRFIKGLSNNIILDFVSLRTKEQFDFYLTTRNYDDFHLGAHYFMIDNIITWLNGRPKSNIKRCIESTLTCATTKDLKEELLKLVDKT